MKMIDFFDAFDSLRVWRKIYDEWLYFFTISYKLD